MTDRLIEIFEQQRSHMEKYAEIEDNNGLLQTPNIPVDLQDRFGQARLKDFAWRMTEELGEALDSYRPTGRDAYDEEISDVLHFLTEFTILAGMTPEDVAYFSPADGQDYLSVLYVTSEPSIPEKFHSRSYNNLVWATGVFIQNLAMACNYLKNKPWKQSVRETDTAKFSCKVIDTWHAFINLCKVADIDADYLHALYTKKSAINKQRQKSGY